MKRPLSVLLAILLLTLPAATFAAPLPSPKEEVVYGILNRDGSVNNIYVVNSFSGGDIADYGNYTEVQNLSTSDPLTLTGDGVTVHTSADRLYYQGTLASKALPWNVSIRYTLDGKAISGADLAGKSGMLQIAMSVSQNPAVNPAFYDNYALQISLALDTKLCKNIVANDATVAEAGSKKQIVYTVLPGNGANIYVSANVHDFEMDAITINGIKLMFNMAIDDNVLTGELSQLVDALKKLDSGAGDLLFGVTELSDGMKQYTAGLKDLKDGLAQLDSGVGDLNDGAAALKQGLSDLEAQNEALLSGAHAIQASTFDAVNTQLATMGLGLPALAPENYASVLEGVPALSDIKAQLDGVVQFTNGLTGYIGGVSQLKAGSVELADGVSELKANTGTIASSANDLYNAAAQLNSAIGKLRGGLASYKDGTKKLKNETSSMDSEIKSKVDEIMDDILGGGAEVVSFVSNKNTSVNAVQFLLKTDAITLPEKAVQEEEKPVELTFWQKFLKLFGA